MKIYTTLCFLSVSLLTSCLSVNQVKVQHYDLGLRTGEAALSWKVGSVSFAGYRSDKLLTREGQSLKEEHSLRWKEEPDELLKNYCLVNYESQAGATPVNLELLRFEFYQGKAQVLAIMTWDKGQKSQRLFTEAPVQGLTVKDKVAAMAQAVEQLMVKISQAVQ